MTDEFLGVFRYLQKKRKPLKLLNVYKGLPVVSEVQILYVGTRSIIIKPESSQFVCLYNDRQTFIQNDVFPRTVRANIEELDILSGEVALSGFYYTDSGIGERRHLRVAPNEPVRSILQRIDLQEAIIGQLADLSREGLAILIQSEFPTPFIDIGAQVIAYIELPVRMTVQNASLATIQPDDTTSIPARPDVDGRFLNLERSLYRTPPDIGSSIPRVRLVNGKSELGLLGVIVNIHPTATNQRIGLHLAQRHAANELLHRFISLRQSEIIRELRAIYEELVNRQH